MAKPIIPVYSEQLPDGKMLWGLGPTDFERIRQGYGCGSCLEAWDFYQPSCPTCKLPVLADAVPTPNHWLPSPEHEDEVPAGRPAGWSPIDDALNSDSALGEVGRFLAKKRR